MRVSLYDKLETDAVKKIIGNVKHERFIEHWINDVRLSDSRLSNFSHFVIQ